MSPSQPRQKGIGERWAPVRASALFQAKLIVDGLRDFLLVPVSLVAILVGLLRGGNAPEREFGSVIDVGRKTERWINLFGAVSRSRRCTDSADRFATAFLQRCT